MPEKGVLRLNEREVGWEELQPSSIMGEMGEDDDPLIGQFVTHPPPPAKKGETPPPPSYHCQSCNGESDEEEDDEDDAGSTSSILTTNLPSKILNKSPADFINELNITGRIFAKARGKELIFAFRLNFALEGHCYWIPTSWYKQIVSQPPVPRGKKSMAYLIPDEFIDGPGFSFGAPESHLVYLFTRLITGKDNDTAEQFQRVKRRGEDYQKELCGTRKKLKRSHNANLNQAAVLVETQLENGQLRDEVDQLTAEVTGLEAESSMLRAEVDSQKSARSAASHKLYAMSEKIRQIPDRLNTVATKAKASAQDELSSYFRSP
ncbi:hypothetical protein B0H11DRAFT_2271108 [Mycena galericulata]|nr:hypothetical protein B0H11DRAFT_2271108 [Mycena galericulata]